MFRLAPARLMEDRRASPHGLARTFLEQAPPSRGDGHGRVKPTTGDSPPFDAGSP